MIPLDLWPAVDLSGQTVALVVIVAFAAGWVDAVVGGGGLLQLPALLLVPGLAPVQALATNKLASIFGTATSSLTYYRRIKPDLRTAIPMASCALVGSFFGATVATILPAALFKPVIVAALIAVAIFVAVRPQLGAQTSLRFAGVRHLAVASALATGIGFYDGMIGPGTGTFLIIALVSVIGYNFVAASATAKIVNFATNFGALVLFVSSGAVVWALALPMALANMCGGYLGSRTAIAKGAGFVRVVFLIVVAALIVKLGFDVWQEFMLG